MPDKSPEKSADCLESLLDLEQIYYQEGYDEGYLQGLNESLIEGKQFGIQTGFQRYVGTGVLLGVSEVFRRARASGVLQMRDPQLVEKNLSSIETFGENIPTQNDANAVAEFERLSRLIRNKSRVVNSMISLPGKPNVLAECDMLAEKVGGGVQEKINVVNAEESW